MEFNQFLEAKRRYDPQAMQSEIYSAVLDLLEKHNSAIDGRIYRHFVAEKAAQAAAQELERLEA